jgi:hypothetical protein
MREIALVGDALRVLQSDVREALAPGKRGQPAVLRAILIDQRLES